MTERYDAIVIGAGHNGLVCSTLLARAGKRVLLLEANEVAGGAAITREFAADFRVSACAHLLYQLQPGVRKAMGISPRNAADDIWTIVLSADGGHVRYRDDTAVGVSDADAAEYRDFRRRMKRFARLLNRQLNSIPPRIGGDDKRDLLKLVRLGVDLRLLGRADMREFLRIIGMNIRDELVERFGNPLLRGGISADAVLGTHLGPRSPGSLLTYLYRIAATGGRLAQPAGGMGAITGAMLDAAKAAGVEIRTGTPAAEIIVDNGRVVGVRDGGGAAHESLTVVSSANPKTTVFDLVGARHFEARFVKRIRDLRVRGNVGKLHLALKELPIVNGLDAKDLGNRLLLAPDEDYVERAFDPAKYGRFSTQPVVEVTLPSCVDPTLAPADRHVLSAVFQYAPYELKGGWNESSRGALEDAVLGTLERYMPGLAARIGASELLLPGDLEQQFHLTGGHWHHVELSLDQFLFVRPVAGAAQYRLPLDGLYLCGAGAHPGGGVSGAAGKNAAAAILAREQPRWL